jgi:hypothetical protein
MQGIKPNFADDAIDVVDEFVDPDIEDEEEQILEHEGIKCCS